MLWKIRIFFQVHFVNHSVLNFFTFLASFVGVSPSHLPFLLQGRVGDPVASFHSSPFLIAFHFLHDFAAAAATSIFPFSSDHEKKERKISSLMALPSLHGEVWNLETLLPKDAGKRYSFEMKLLILETAKITSFSSTRIPAKLSREKEKGRRNM